MKRPTKADILRQLQDAREASEGWRREVHTGQRAIERLTAELAREKHETECLRALLAAAESKETACVDVEFPEGGSIRFDGPARLTAPVATALAHGFADTIRVISKRNE